MQLFYLENPEEEILLSPEESKHVTKALRKKEGDILNFTDGKGILYKAKIILANNRDCRLRILSSEKKEKQHKYHLHIAISPTKNMDRFKFFIEKSTEIGIDEITPIICNHSERKKINLEKCKKISISAMKQSERYHLPKFNKSLSFTEFMKKEAAATKYIAHCQKGKKNEFQKENIGKEIIILIGPEGDFSKEEILKAIEKKYKPISLGSVRLRTETAGIMAVTISNIKQ